MSRPDHQKEGVFSRDKEIRCYYDGRYGYIYNDCYRKDGLKKDPLGSIIPYGDASLEAMKRASEKDKSIKKRYESFLLRAPEELYDWSADPGSWKNLAGNPEYLKILMGARKGLFEWMTISNDPLTDTYVKFIKDSRKK